MDYRDTVGTSSRPERLLVVTSDGAFSEAVGTALDRERRLVDRVASPAELEVRLDETRCDTLVVDHDGETIDAIGVVESVRERDSGLPIVVTADVDAGGVASDALDAGATTFARRDDPAAVADSVNVVARRGSAPETDQREAYRTLVDAVLEAGGVGVVVSDETGTVRWVTDAVGQFLDVPTDRPVGASRRQLVRERLAPAVTDGSALAGRLLSPDGTERFLIRTDQLETARWLACRTDPLESEPFAGGRVDRFVDVTRFVRQEDGLRELQQLMVRPDVTFAERLHEVLELGSERLDLSYGFVTGIDDGVQSVLDSVGDHELLQPGESAPLLQTYCRKTLAAEGLVAIPDAPDAGWANDPAYETFGLDAYIGAPVGIHGENYGTLCFAASDPRSEFTDEEELFVEFAAAWAGWELERYDTVER